MVLPSVTVYEVPFHDEQELLHWPAASKYWSLYFS